MPTYDYRCDGCAYQFEEMQSFSADKLKKCPKCGEDKLRRLFGTGGAILFRGGGFYETDYKRGEGYKKSEQADSAAGKPAESKPAPPPTPSTSPATGSSPAKSDGPAK
jgi:putative FmdB family regulatory protein